MAFGFGFNKQKVLSAAEKFVQQGKLQNAIAEYDKILKHDENDLTVNNTIGDLYARLGDSAKAIECFKKVGDAYAAQGFTVKGIAMYKKITKITPSVDGSLKLAELYTQQGLFNDARAQYLQVAEDFMKNGDLDQAVRLFQKVLEMDPENVPMRIKLAEVYVRLGKKKEAWEIFGAAAESLRARGSAAAAEDVLKRMMVLDPGNGGVLLLRGRAALESDDPKSAIEYLEKTPDLDSHPEGLRDLLKAYLQVGNSAQAGPIAEKLLTVHNDPEGLFLLAEGCTRLGQYPEALAIYDRHADRLLATDSTKLLSSLHGIISHVRDNSDALDTLLLLLNKAGESTHVNEVTELLAHASVKDGNLSRARDLYQMLATTEPQNQMHMQNYQQVVARMEGESPSIGITAEEGAVIVEELEATAPIVDESYPDQIAIAVRAAVTDADLFLSYNLPDKAVVPLLGALPLAPRDVRLNQRLAALHTRFQRFTEAAVCCRTLESVYHDAGYPDEAVRYGELAARYEQSADAKSSSSSSSSLSSVAAAAAASAAPAARAVSVPGWPTSKPTSKVSSDAAAAPPEFGVMQESTAPMDAAEPALAGFPEAGAEISSEPSQELSSGLSSHSSSDSSDLSSDLSSEWEDSLSVDAQPAPAKASPAGHAAGSSASDAASNPEIAETVEEVRFYLEHFMMDQARAGLEKLESMTSDAGILGSLRSAIASAGQPPAEPEPEITEINGDEIGVDEINADEISLNDSSLHHSPAAEPAEFAVEMSPSDGSAIPASPDLMSGYDGQTNEQFHVDASIEEAPQPAHAEPAYAETIETQPEFAEPEPAEPQPAEPVHAEAAPAEAGGLSSFVADLEASLGDSFPQAPPLDAPKATPAKTAAAKRPAGDRPAAERPAADRPAADRPAADRPIKDQPLPGWPVAAPKRATTPVPAAPELEPQPVAKTKTTTKTTTPTPKVGIPARCAKHACGCGFSRRGGRGACSRSCTCDELQRDAGAPAGSRGASDASFRQRRPFRDVWGVETGTRRRCCGRR